MTEPSTPPPFVPYVPGPPQQIELLPPMGPPTVGMAPVSPIPADMSQSPMTGSLLLHGSPPAAKRPRTGLIIAGTAAAAVLLVAAGAVGALVLTSDKSPVDAVKAAAGPRTFKVSGTLTLQDSGGYSTSGNCRGLRGYNDIAEGASVTISDAAGATVAIGRLGPGSVQTFGCVLAFSVSDVPAGKGFYGIEVSHRGVVKYSEAEISKGTMTLTLG